MPPPSVPPPHLTDALLGRQPIFDDALNVVGYEVLYRSERAARALVKDGSRATGSVLSHLLLEFGLQEVVGTAQAWVNFPQHYLVEQLPMPVEPSRLVVEVLDDVQPTPEVIEALRLVKRKGYRIAMGEHTLSARYADMLDTAYYVKVDVNHLDRVRPKMLGLRRRKLRLVATMLETEEHVAAARNLGFDLYQGYHLCRPNLLAKRKPPTNKLALVRLLAEVQAPDVQLQNIENLITSDPVLALKVLRYCNSSAFSMAREIDSIQHAIVLLGKDGIRNLITLLTVASAGDRPPELLSIALTRAHACEQLADEKQGARPETLFTAGLFSLLDAILERPMAEILDAVPLRAELVDALVQRAGPIGRVIDAVEAHERGRYADVEAAGFDPQDVSRAWLAGLRWANELQKMLASSGQNGRSRAKAAAGGRSVAPKG